MIRPLLKWAGGKALLVDHIAAALPPVCAGTYYEPFMGSGAVIIGRRAAGHVGPTVVSDINPRLVAFHVAVRDRVEDVICELGRLPAEGVDADTYYRIRADLNGGGLFGCAGPSQAARFLWLNKSGFNGLCRENGDGEFNVAWNHRPTVSLPTADHIRQVSALLAGVEIVCADFEDTIGRAGRGDHVYCDPPYGPQDTGRSWTGYSSSPFGPAQHMRLSRAIRAAAARGAHLAVSDHDSAHARDVVYLRVDGFRHTSIEVHRSINRDGKGRGRVRELLASIGPAT